MFCRINYSLNNKNTLLIDYKENDVLIKMAKVIQSYSKIVYKEI